MGRTIGIVAPGDSDGEKRGMGRQMSTVKFSCTSEKSMI